MPSTKKWPDNHMRAMILLLFFLSGFTGLVYQIVWMKRLSTVFGVSSYAVATVVTSFMAGFAVGAYVLGKVSDRSRNPLRLYAILEIGIGCYAFATPFLFDAIAGAHTLIYRNIHGSFHTFSLIRFLLSFAILIFPTFLMGGTLPAISRTWIRRIENAGKGTGMLYGLNTFGAVAGCFVAGFYLIRAIGLQQSTFLTVIVNLAIGCIAIVLSSMKAWKGAQGTSFVDGRSPSKKDEACSTVPPSSLREDTPGGNQSVETGENKRTLRKDALEKSTIWLILIAYGIAGFTSLAYEVIWARILSMNTENTTYSFTIILAVFLLGIAIGSYIYSKRLKFLPQLRLFGLIEIILGTYNAGLIFFFRYLPLISYEISKLLRSFQYFDRHPWFGTVTVELLLCFVVVLVPTILMGITFPLVVHLCAGTMKKLGFVVGRAYSLNTTGSLLGSFSAGFLLIPFVGIHRSLTFLVIVNMVIGSVILVRVRNYSARWIPWTVGALAGFCALLYCIVYPQIYIKGDYYRPPHLRRQKLLYYNEGNHATVTVSLIPGSGEPKKILEINGVGVAGTGFVTGGTQKLQGHLPLLLHDAPVEVLTVGIGSGETGYVIGLYDVAKIIGVELLENVLEAAPFFEEINHGIYQDPRVEIVIDDARTYLAGTDRKFDIIMNDSIHPARLGNAALYTQDYFQECRDRLKPGGIMSSWLPNIGLSERDFQMILKTFQSVFPNATLWMIPNYINQHPILIGTLQERAIDIDSIREKMSADTVAGELSQIRLDNVFELLNCLVMDEEAIREYTENAPVNTDDQPILEFSTPFVMFENIWSSGNTDEMANDLETFNRFRKSPLSLYDLETPAPSRYRSMIRLQEDYFKSTSFIIEGHIEKLRDNDDGAADHYRRAVDILPEWDDAQLLLQNTLLKLGRQAFGGGDFEKAIEYYTEATELSVENSYPYYQLGLINLIRRRYDAALPYFDRALRIDPELARAYYQKAQAYIALGQKNNAVENLKKVLELEPDLIQVREMIGKLESGDM
jgi:spermidine synthase